MRELKFRAWDKSKKQMFNNPSGRLFQGQLGASEHSEIELMQYTGLRDKHGVEVYEGDILTTKGFDYLKVYWFQHFAGFYCESENANALRFDNRTAVEGEIIGNIWENKELLNE